MDTEQPWLEVEKKILYSLTQLKYCKLSKIEKPGINLFSIQVPTLVTNAGKMGAPHAIDIYIHTFHRPYKLWTLLNVSLNNLLRICFSVYSF